MLSKTQEDNYTREYLIKKALQKARRKYIEAEIELNNLYDFLSDINADLEVPTDAENTAAATEEVTASSEELTALMNTVNENCNKMHNISIDLVNDLNRFTV